MVYDETKRIRNVVGFSVSLGLMLAVLVVTLLVCTASRHCLLWPFLILGRRVGGGTGASVVLAGFTRDRIPRALFFHASVAFVLFRILMHTLRISHFVYFDDPDQWNPVDGIGKFVFAVGTSLYPSLISVGLLNLWLDVVVQLDSGRVIRQSLIRAVRIFFLLLNGALLAVCLCVSVVYLVPREVVPLELDRILPAAVGGPVLMCVMYSTNLVIALTGGYIVIRLVRAAGNGVSREAQEKTRVRATALQRRQRSRQRKEQRQQCHGHTLEGGSVSDPVSSCHSSSEYFPAMSVPWRPRNAVTRSTAQDDGDNDNDNDIDGCVGDELPSDKTSMAADHGTPASAERDRVGDVEVCDRNLGPLRAELRSLAIRIALCIVLSMASTNLHVAGLVLLLLRAEPWTVAIFLQTLPECTCILFISIVFWPRAAQLAGWFSCCWGCGWRRDHGSGTCGSAGQGGDRGEDRRGRHAGGGYHVDGGPLAVARSEPGLVDTGHGAPPCHQHTTPSRTALLASGAKEGPASLPHHHCGHPCSGGSDSSSNSSSDSGHRVRFGADTLDGTGSGACTPEHQHRGPKQRSRSVNDTHAVDEESRALRLMPPPPPSKVARGSSESNIMVLLTLGEVPRTEPPRYSISSPGAAAETAADGCRQLTEQRGVVSAPRPVPFPHMAGTPGGHSLAFDDEFHSFSLTP